MQHTARTMLDHALSYAAAGLPVLPLHSVLQDGTCTCGTARCPSPGKHPRTRNGLKDATTDPATINKWWGANRWPHASIGGVGGAFLCIDVDAKNDGLETLERLIAANTALPDTAVAETGEYEGSRGKHYWYRVPDDVKAATRTGVRQGIDIRCSGGYAVMPPSKHTSGVAYEWLTGGFEDVAPCPEWVLELVPEHVEGDATWTPDPAFKMSKQVKQFLKGELEVSPGEQRDFLVAAARSILTTGRSVELAASMLWEGDDGTGGIANCEWGAEPWTPEDIYAIVSDIYAKPPTTPMDKDFTSNDYSHDDAGNAERLLASFPDGHVRYSPELDKWFIWDAQRKRFVVDNGTFMRQRQLKVMQELTNSAMQSRDEGQFKALFNWARTSRMKPRVDAAVSMAGWFPRVGEAELDSDPLLFAVENGVVDLRNGRLREATIEDMLTRFSSTRYVPGATSEVWDQFLEQAIPDEDLRDFLQLACGYSLTGSIDEHKFFYLYGRPATGKSTFLEAFSRIMGTYVTVADTSSFMRSASRNGNGPTEDLARLAGARVVVTHEVEENERMAAALVAQFTGGDAVSARFLYGKPFEYYPRFKLWIAANHRARISGARSGIWRRMMVVPMDEVVPADERDPTLAHKLREPEAQSAILAWAVEGAVMWHELNSEGHELHPPEVMQRESEAYQHESDHLYAFIDEVVAFTEDSHKVVPKADLFEYYKAWCDREGRERRVTSQVLSRRLGDLGCTHRMAWLNGKSQRVWENMQIKGPRVPTREDRDEDV